MAGQPLLDLGMFVRGIVIRDQIDLLACRGDLGQAGQCASVWLPLGSDFLTGWKSAIEAAITLGYFENGRNIRMSQALHFEQHEDHTMLWVDAP
jgi:hypothetical protein